MSILWREMDAREILNRIFTAALSSVNPALLIKGHIDGVLSEYVRGRFRQLFIIGFGKASCQMAGAVEGSIDNNLITNGIVITKYGHGISQESGVRSQESGGRRQKSKIKIYEAGHPIPDEKGIRATRESISLLKKADKDTLILCLISGGGSALFVSPYNGITLDKKQRITELLLKAGADITELNAVRKHISKVKGGRLAEIAYPATIITLILSDVMGDKLDVIASGPTAPDTTTFSDALDVISKFKLVEKIPERVIDILIKGKQGLIPETPKEDNHIFKNIKNIVIGNNLQALNAAKEKAQSLGVKAEIISSNISGEARDAGKWLAEKAIESKGTKAQRHKGARCLISGGETTVTVRGNGKGGRNTELALSFAGAIEGVEGITMLSAGTDGTDGPTDAAGAIVDGRTIAKAKSLGLDPESYLNNNDSYNFFKETDSLLITGPTGTNVMDVQIILV